MGLTCWQAEAERTWGRLPAAASSSSGSSAMLVLRSDCFCGVCSPTTSGDLPANALRQLIYSLTTPPCSHCGRLALHHRYLQPPGLHLQVSPSKPTSPHTQVLLKAADDGL